MYQTLFNRSRGQIAVVSRVVDVNDALEKSGPSQPDVVLGEDHESELRIELAQREVGVLTEGRNLPIETGWKRGALNQVLSEISGVLKFAKNFAGEG